MDYQIVTADVFTDRVFGGNPLAVFPNAVGIEGAVMQQIARETNLSETVFVLPPDDPAHTRRLRIFTPTAELPFAGHPTVGAAFVLAAIGDIALTGAQTSIVFEEGVGPVPVTIQAEDGRPVFSQLSVAKLPEFGPPAPATEDVAAMLSLDPGDVLTGEVSRQGDHPQAVSCGVPFLYVPLKDRDAVARAKIRRDIWERVLAESWASWIYLFSYETSLPDSDLHARMFAPVSGLEEDPATGAAAAAFAGYLASRDVTTDGSLRWIVEQGFEMGRPSLLHIEADKAGGEVTAVRVGGQSVLVSKGTMTLP